MSNTEHLITIRTALEAETDLICRLWEKLADSALHHPYGGEGEDRAERTRTLVLHSITEPEALALVAESNGLIIGTLSAYVYNKPAVALPRVGVLYSLWIEPDYRRKGYGHALFAEAERRLSEMGAQSLQVAWETDSIPAQSFWQKEGFRGYELIASKPLGTTQIKE